MVPEIAGGRGERTAHTVAVARTVAEWVAPAGGSRGEASQESLQGTGPAQTAAAVAEPAGTTTVLARGLAAAQAGAGPEVLAPRPQHGATSLWVSQTLVRTGSDSTRLSLQPATSG